MQAALKLPMLLHWLISVLRKPGIKNTTAAQLDVRTVKARILKVKLALNSALGTQSDAMKYGTQCKSASLLFGILSNHANNKVFDIRMSQVPRDFQARTSPSVKKDRVDLD